MNSPFHPLAVTLALAGLLTGCGKPLATAPARPSAPIAAAARTTLGAAAGHAADAAWEGKRVRLSAAFARHTYSPGYGVTRRGYRLVAPDAPDAPALLVQNVYAESSAGLRDDGADFAPEAATRLLAGAVEVEGVFHVQRQATSHSGVVDVPAGVVLTRVDGRPIAELINR